MADGRAAPAFDVDGLLDDPTVGVAVCCGAGGVGKTTTAAALAVRAAERGRAVAVLTIDPARRLTQSLGLRELDNSPRRVPGVPGPQAARSGGRLDALVLDMKRTFDEVVSAHASAAKARQILANPFYESLSTSFAGTQEYMAMEKLGQLRVAAQRDRRWDLIVVDTPPSRSALDFLDAPGRLASFLDGRLIRVLLAPARGPARLVSSGLGAVTGVLARVIGAQVLRDVQAFVAAFDTVFGGFRKRAEETYRLLQGPETAFVVVAAPQPDALREAAYFIERLHEEQMPLAGLVLNRTTPVHAGGLSADRAAAAAEQLGEMAVGGPTAALLRLHADRARLARRERRLLAGFSGAHPQVAVTSAPAMPTDVHDVAGLRALGAALAR